MAQPQEDLDNKESQQSRRWDERRDFINVKLLQCNTTHLYIREGT